MADQVRHDGLFLLIASLAVILQTALITNHSPLLSGLCSRRGFFGVFDGLQRKVVVAVSFEV
jgi:hypothetical protein